MSKWLFFFILSINILTFNVAWSSEIQLERFKPSCDLDLYQVGSLVTTPVQQETEWMLKVKGYRINHKNSSKFDRSTLQINQLFGSYRAGDVSQSVHNDCSAENYKSFGAFYTCAYELNLVTVNHAGELVLFASVSASLRDAPSAEPFYQSIRNQLMALPACR